MKVKFCGFRFLKDVEVALSLQVDYVGFVLHPASLRFISLDDLIPLLRLFKESRTKSVAVLVNPEVSLVLRLIDVGIDILQFHGEEDEAFCKQFQHPYWKAFRVAQKKDLESIVLYPLAEAHLLDGYHSKEHGGSGTHFDWTYLDDFKSKKPYFVAGGINLENIHELMKRDVYGVDISSGIESSKGVKDVLLMQKMMEKIRGENGS